MIFLFSHMNHDVRVVQSDSLPLYFIYAKRRPSFSLKLIFEEKYNRHGECYGYKEVFLIRLITALSGHEK